MSIKLFADGADLATMANQAKMPAIRGWTTNPTLMRKAGITDYVGFALDALAIVGDRPISFEVFADEPDEMIRQAKLIASWGPNVYVKIPVVNTRGQFMGEVIRELAVNGVKLNVTAVMTHGQVELVIGCLDPATPAIISIFAGRIADTGVDPIHTVARATKLCYGSTSKVEILWASPRQVLDIYRAIEARAHIITVTDDILAKTKLIDKDLLEYSRETSQMFFDDAKKAGYTLDPPVEVGDGLGR